MKRRPANADVDALVRQYSAAVYATCLRITRDRHDAEDAMQAVFLCLSIQLGDGEKIHAMGPWLTQVARRAAIDICRRRKRQRTHEAAFAAETNAQAYEAPESKTDFADIRPIVLAALNELPAKYRMALVLHYFGGMDQEQLAGELACSRVNLRVRMHRGHKMLREMLQRRGVQLAGGLLVAALADAVRYQVSQSLVSASAVHAGQLSVSAFGGSGMLAMAGGMSAMRLKVLLAAMIGVAAVSAATAPLLARLRTQWQEIHVRPMLDAIPAIPTFTSPLPTFSDAATPQTPPNPAKSHIPSGFASAEIPPLISATVMNQPMTFLPASPDITSARSATPPARSATHSAIATTTKTPAYQLPATVVTAGYRDDDSVQVRHHAGRDARPEPAFAPIASASIPPLVIGQRTTSPWSPARNDVALNCESVGIPRVLPSSNYLPGDLVNNGQVIANGTNLNYASFTRVLNTQENTMGVNGWFANNRGSITLPPIRLTKGHNRHNWGESDDDPTIDLINSLSIHADAAAASELSISLLATDHPLVPALPAGHHFVGIWKMDGGQMLTEGLDLTIRYDDTRLASLGLDESLVKLWYYDAGAWTRLTDSSFGRDTARNIVYGHVPAADFYAVSTPEPTGAVFAIIAGSALLLRRRRR